MNKMSNVKKSIYTAACIALCVVLPMAFHSIENSGSVICPMHIPALLCGLICGWPLGILCGLAGPLLSMLITGMPAAAYLAPMMLELAVYGLVAGLLMKWVRTKNLYADLYISLIVAMIVGRLVAGAARALIFSAGSYSLAAWTASYFVTCLPGIVIQLALIPTIVFALERTNLIPRRYPKARG
jgi:riboflavin transporter FmnP